MQGMCPPGGQWVGVAGLDLVRDADGELLVLEDNLRTPSGFAYAFEARRAVLSLVEPPGEPPRPLDAMPGMLADTLRAASPGTGDPVVVVLTDGPDNSAAFEHAWAAEALGVPLVEPDDLELRGDVLRHEGARRRRRVPAHGRRRRRHRGRRAADAAAAGRDARHRQRVRDRRRRRQARARICRGSGAFPPRRGAAAALGRDVRPRGRRGARAGPGRVRRRSS